MKSILLIFTVFCLLNHGYSQAFIYEKDTARKSKELNVESDSCKGDTLKHIMFNTKKASEMMYLEHNEFSAGLHMSIIGTAGGVLFSYLASKDQATETYFFTLAGASTVLNIIGGILMVDSHKYRRKAGYYLRQAGGGIGVGYCF